MSRPQRFVLTRTLPGGSVKAWPDAMTVREAGKAVAYCLADNAAASRQEATQVGMAVEQTAQTGGGSVAAFGYVFQVVPWGTPIK